MANRRQLGRVSSEDCPPAKERPPNIEPQPLFPGVDDEQLIIRLLGYADALLHMHTWQGTRGGEPPDGAAGDLVQTAFVQYFAQLRHHPEGLPAYTFMAGVIRSRLSHLIEKHKHENVPHLPIVNDPAAWPAAVAAETIPARDTACTDATHAIAEKWLPRLRSTFGESSLVVRYVELVASGTSGSASTRAEALGVDVRDVFNVHRQLRRFARRFLSAPEGRRS
jgi:DNA-directed RNA polymerase specialized sigma24 family protein